MPIENNLESVLEMTRGYAEALLTAQPMALGEKCPVPSTGGVYAIYEKTGLDGLQRIYVGKASNLSRRIYCNHLSGAKEPKSSLRWWLNEKRQIPIGPEGRDWLAANCSIAFVVVENADIRGLVEAAVIAAVRTPQLYNMV